MESFVRIVRLLSQLCGFVAAGLIALGVFVVCHMVFERYVFGHDTIWQTDFVTYSLVAATFVGSPYVLMLRGHVNVDILPIYSGPTLRFWLALFSSVLSLAFCIAMAVLTFQFWHEAWGEGWVSDTMWRARLWIPYSSMPIGMSVISLQCLADLTSLISGKEPPFGMTSGHR